MHLRARNLLPLLLIVTLGSAACGSDQTASRESTSGEMVAVHVTSNGVITMNGRTVSRDELRQEFRRLASAGGKVLYSRDDPTRAPHPNAMKVMETVVETNVTLLMAEPVAR